LKLPLFIANRYLLSRRKKNFINVISIFSVIAVAVITAAIIIVMSVFNGLESLLHSLNNSFDPEIKIEAARGKSFHSGKQLISKIRDVEGVSIITEVIEDYAYVRYREANQIVILKGVSDNFVEQKRIPDENIVAGKLQLHEKGVAYAVVGTGVKASLSIAVGDAMFPLQIYYIKNTKSLDPSQMYVHRNIIAGGEFSIVQNFDDNYIILPLDFTRDLLDYSDKLTSLEIKVNAGTPISKVHDRLQAALGSDFNVLTLEEQHKDLYRLLKMEKLFTFLALCLLLAIGSINIFFSLMMLALDKKKDISVLSAMGANNHFIRSIFLTQGALIAGIGTLIGLLFGAAICWLQGVFGIFSMGMETSIVQSYPVRMVWTDFAMTLSMVGIITFAITLWPATLATRSASIQHL
jgi:lipoprotein-releasing system permease protein